VPLGQVAQILTRLAPRLLLRRNVNVVKAQGLPVLMSALRRAATTDSDSAVCDTALCSCRHQLVFQPFAFVLIHDTGGPASPRSRVSVSSPHAVH
jgi:hypothetical protein